MKQRYLTERLALIPSAKLVITDIGYWLHLNTEVLPQKTLHVRINDRSKLALATILELLNKRWQTLDLISVFREVQRTLPIKTTVNSLIKGISKFLFLFVTYLKICPAFQDFRKRNYEQDTYTPPASSLVSFRSLRGRPACSSRKTSCDWLGKLRTNRVNDGTYPENKRTATHRDPANTVIRGSEELQADTPSLSRESFLNEPRRGSN